MERKQTDGQIGNAARDRRQDTAFEDWTFKRKLRFLEKNLPLLEKQLAKIGDELTRLGNNRGTEK